MAELDIEHVVRIARSQLAVWRFVAEEYVAHHHLWDPAVTGMRQLSSGPMGTGVTGEESRRVGGRIVTTRFVVDEHEPSHRFAFHDTAGPFALARSYELSQTADGGTELRFRFTMSPRGGMRLLFPLMRRSIERQVRANIDRIPGAVVEHSTRSP